MEQDGCNLSFMCVLGKTVEDNRYKTNNHPEHIETQMSAARL